MVKLIDVNVDSGGRLVLSTVDASGNKVLFDQKDLVAPLGATGWSAAEGIEASFKISNYHFANDYDVSTTNGTVRIVDDTIYYVPSVRGPGGFLLNGTFCAVTVTTSDPSKPVLTAPTFGAQNQLKAVVLQTGAFSSSDPSVTHAKTRWQIATDPYFLTTVMDVVSDTNLASIQATGLNWSTAYYARAQHIGTKP